MFVQILIIFNRCFPMNCLMRVPSGFEYVHGADIPLQHTCKDAINLEILKDIICHDRYGLGHNTSPPVVFTNPIPDFGIVPIDIVLDCKANITNRLPIYFDCQVVGLLVGFVGAYPRVGITGGVRIRKKVAHVVPDMPITGMPNQRLFVALTPGTKLADRKRKADQRSSQRSSG